VPDPLQQRRLAYLETAKAVIREHGWMVQGVFDADAPFAYTVGLTEAGLPELILALPEQSTLWFKFGQRMLNDFAKQSLTEELALGRAYPWTDEITVTVREARISHDDLWPGFAYELYGRPRVRVLELWPQLPDSTLEGRGV
jgi:hypothetical protein